MKRFLYLFALLSLFILSCTPKVSQNLIKDDGKIEVVLVQLNDVYEIAPLEGGKVGGMARVGALINQLKAENPNTFTILAGDFLSPSLIGNLKNKGKRIKGEQMIAAMNAIGVDIVTFGNHEFDLKMPELQSRLNESNFIWLGTSVREIQNNQQIPFAKIVNGKRKNVPDTYTWNVKDADGTMAKIGFFGTTIDSNPKKFVYYNDFYKRPIEEAQKLSKQTDVVLGITHLEIAQDEKLAAQMPVDVPLFMGGHDHDNMRVVVGKTTITKADANAKSVYVHRILIDKNGEKPTTQVNSELIKITDALPSDPQVEKIVNQWMNLQDSLVVQVYSQPYEKIYTATEPLDALEASIRNFQTNYGTLNARAMSAAAKQDIVGAFTNGGSTRIDDQLSGDIYAIDIFRALPFGGGIVEVKMKGSLLKKMLNQGQKNKGKGGFLQLDQFEFSTTQNDWLAKGETVKDDAAYWVVVTDFLLTGLESGMDFFTEDNPEIIEIDKPTTQDDIRRDIRLVFIEYLKRLK